MLVYWPPDSNFSTLLSINTLIISFALPIFPFNLFYPLDSCFSNLFLLLFWQSPFFKQHVRKQSNKHITSLKQRWQDAHLGYSELLYKTTALLWSSDERMPLAMLASCFLVRTLWFLLQLLGSRHPLSSPLYHQSQMSTFQTNLQVLFQVFTTENLPYLLQSTDLSCLWTLVTCFPYLKTQYLRINSHMQL